MNRYLRSVLVAALAAAGLSVPANAQQWLTRSSVMGRVNEVLNDAAFKEMAPKRLYYRMALDYYWIEGKCHHGKVVFKDKGMPPERAGEVEFERPGDPIRTRHWTKNEVIRINRAFFTKKYESLCRRCPMMPVPIKKCFITDLAYSVIRHEMVHANCDVGNSQTKYNANECNAWTEQLRIMCAYQDALTKYKLPPSGPCTPAAQWEWWKKLTKKTKDGYCG